MKKILFFLFLLLLIGCTVNVNNTPQQKTISVQGNSEFTTSPDEVKLYIRIETKATTPKQAQDMNRERSNTVIAALKNNGFAEENIKSTQYNLQKQEHWDPDTQRIVATGYLLIHVIEATSKDIDNAGKVADLVIDAGATGVDSVQFTLSEEKKKTSNEEALKKAIENAREKANTIAKSLDISLGKAEFVSESNVYYSPRYYGRVEYAKATTDAMPTEIQPNDVTVSAQVSVSFGIS
ncbi:MAG: SIMPL domain-containing protein [Candidatus Woesearchaeota archaeon]